MKHARKLATLLLALVMVLSLATTAFAAGNDGSITISNATVGATYDVYKVFDLTYTENAVAYSFTKTGGTDALHSALIGNSSPFTLTAATTENVYNVSLKDGKNAADVSKFLTDNKTLLTRIGGEKTAASSEVKFENLPYGYYYITSSLGAVVTIDSAKKDVTVIDKNQTIPVPDKQESVDGGTSYQYQGTTQETSIPTAGIGDTVNYRVKGDFTQFVGENVVKALKFTDTMSAGLTADQNVAVKINGTALTKDTGYNVTYTLNDNNTTDDSTDDYWVTTITIPTATVDSDGKVAFKYNVNNTYEITYSAKIDKDAVIDVEEKNTVALKYTDKNDTDHDVGRDNTKVKNYDITLNKKDGKNTTATDDDTPLAGAKFELYEKGGTTPLNVVLLSGENYGDGTVTSEKGNTYRLAENGETTGVITGLVVGKTGKIVVKGLKNGEYQFEETVAPSGYNKLTARQSVNIEDNNASIDVINNAGTELPSTGGMGTTIFYVLGSILAVGAIVLLVTKKRMSAAD